MKTLLVTGGLGLIGSNFINYIFKKGIYKIINMDLEINCNNETSIDAYIRKSSNYVFIKGNIGNKKLVQKTLHKYNIEYILNLAALTFRFDLFENPIQYVENNVLNMCLFLEECRSYNKLKAFVTMSTNFINIIEATHDNKKTHFKYFNPYTVSKSNALDWMIYYRDIYKLPIIVLFSEAIIGKEQCIPAQLIDYLQLLQCNKKIEINLNDTTKINYVYVSNIVTAFEILLSNGSSNKVYKAIDQKYGYNDDLSIAKLAIKFYKKTTDYNKWINYLNLPLHYNMHPRLTENNNLLNLGWKIIINAEQGIKLIADDFDNRHSCKLTDI
jgi:dTDP-glucose 4,6-dehydratase